MKQEYSVQTLSEQEKITQEHFEEFASLISSIHGSIQKLKSHHTMTLGLKSVHIFWLYLLRNHPQGLSASQLAAAGKTSRSLVSREINTLIEQDIIHTLDSSPRRRYGWKFTLTPRGCELADQIAGIAAQVQQQVSSEIPEEELNSFYHSLRILEHNFSLLSNNITKGDTSL